MTSNAVTAVRTVALVGLMLGPAIPVDAAVQLRYRVNQQAVPIAWSPDAFPIQIGIDRNSGGGPAAASVEAALGVWSDDGDSRVSFRTTDVQAPAREDGVNVVTMVDDLMKSSGFLGYTTTWFDSDGKIREADIQIDRSAAQKGGFEALMVHEIGHLLGFDHNANLGSAMYPFVGLELDGLSSDDRMGLASLYPSPGLSGRIAIAGQVTGARGAVLGAHVVAVSASGVVAASAVSDERGRFSFDALPNGTYRFYAEPLDGPVEPRNFDGVYREAPTSFRTTFALGGQGKSGDMVIQLDELPPELNPRWIGAFAPGSSPKLESVAASVVAGQTIDIAVGGDGIIGGMSEFTIENPAVERVSEFRYGANYLWATFRVNPEAANGPAVVLVRTGNEAATLTGALRITGSSGDAPAADPQPGRRRGVRGR